ncbi:hypothetical protein NEOLEDRAFT_1133435 [Neolentinus lepideus HHB14362 ss-1]|uniref:Uncharacterized protein n=1 Tax=Neolentinus lepideus HHB14362 ss-1 TaxID=1314782 RepID=A0A165SPU3_9AGAM|nr:hypothetical protein NEOLEDRAFT_1133435 [Neolentinus lepideus HHB14362 ss-1]
MLPSGHMSYGLGNAALFNGQIPNPYSQGGFYPQQFMGQPFPEPQGPVDPNSPELFKHNMHLVQQMLARISETARSALMGIENAYHPHTSPAQTAAFVNSLKQQIQSLMILMRQSGIGALPVLTSGVPKTEDQLLADATKAIQVLYERHKKIQDSAGIVASLLGASEPSRR